MANKLVSRQLIHVKFCQLVTPSVGFGRNSSGQPVAARHAVGNKVAYVRLADRTESMFDFALDLSFKPMNLRIIVGDYSSTCQEYGTNSSTENAFG